VNDDTSRGDAVGGSGGTSGDPTGNDDAVQPSDRHGPDRRWSPQLIIALTLGAVLLVGVAVAGIVLGPATSTPPAAKPPPVANPTGPVLLVPVDAPKAGTAECAALIHALPATLANGRTPLHSRQLAKPVPPATAVWGSGDEPAVLRCGIERPPELKPTSELLEVDGVQWFQESSGGLTTWYAVDRAATVALTLPGSVGTGPIQDVSAAVGSAMPAVPVF
jgi:hypothetical protein